MVRFLAALTDPLLVQTTETVEAYGSSGSSVAVTTASGNIWTITLSSATVTISLTGSGNSVAEALTLYLTQDGTGGRTVSWPGSVTWLSGSAPAINPTPGGLTVIVLETLNGGTTWYGSASDLALPLAVANGGTGQVSNGVAGQLLASNGTATAWQGLLTQTAPVQATSFTAAQGQLIPVDAVAAGGNVTGTLPGGQFSGALVGVKMINTGSGYTTTLQTAAPDVINRGTGFSAGSYVTQLTLSLLSQGSVLSYCPPGVPYAASFTASSANLALTTGFSVSPFSTGEVVYLTTTVPGGFSSATSYYVVSAASSGGGPLFTWTYTLSATSTGSAITATGSSGTTHIVQSGIWTVVSDDLPLSQLDLRYAGLAGATFAGATAPAVVTLTDASPTVAVNAALGNDFRLLMTSGVGSTRKLGNPGSAVDGQFIRVWVTQDGSGGQFLTYDTNYSFPTGNPSPTLTTAANACDLLGFIYNASKGKWVFAAWMNGV